VLALAFPLHPPRRPDRSRAAELEVAPPLLVVQGERDPLGTPDELRPALLEGRASVRGLGSELVVVPAADHGFGVPRRGPITPTEVDSLIVEAVVGWIAGVAVSRRGGESST
jgi:predicted alpha/beta-hydrolase family hydrolase